MQYKKEWYGRRARRFTIKKEGFDKLESLTGGEMAVFLELLKETAPRVEFDGVVLMLVMSFHKKEIAKKFGYNNPHVVDNMIQKLLKRGVIHRYARQYYEIDPDIISKVEY